MGGGRRQSRLKAMDALGDGEGELMVTGVTGDGGGSGDGAWGGVVDGDTAGAVVGGVVVSDGVAGRAVLAVITSALSPTTSLSSLRTA